jgi:hypothetical protein
MRSLVALTLLVGLAPAAPVPKSLKKPTLADQLVGTWKPNDKGTCWFRFHADGTLQTWHGRDKGVDSKMHWTWAIDPEPSTPHRLKLTRTSEPRQTLDCALELDGDRLTFAFLTGGKKLPERLADGLGLELYQLARDTDGK